MLFQNNYSYYLCFENKMIAIFFLKLYFYKSMNHSFACLVIEDPKSLKDYVYELPKDVWTLFSIF